MKALRIADHSVGEGNSCFVVAEVGSNHNLELSTAKELIRQAATAGADAVKFQSQKLEEQYLPERETVEFRDFFRKTELPEDWYPELVSEAKSHGVIFFASPTYFHAVDLLEIIQVPVYKIASPQVATFPNLVEHVARTGKPVILSAGMVTYECLTKAVNLCRRAGNNQLAILHCVSHYPTVPAEANLKTMATYKAMFGCPVGFSDHTEGYHIALAAVALGACILEKHITLDRRQVGPDHLFSLEIPEFADMVRSIREVEVSLGDGLCLEVSGDVAAFVNRIDMKLVAGRDIQPGTPLTQQVFIHRRADKGVSVSDLPRLEGAVASELVPAFTPLHWHQIRFRKE